MNFQSTCCNLKIRDLRAKLCVQFSYYFNFEEKYDVLKGKSPYILLNKNKNFKKNKTESKMENPTYSFRKTNLVLQLIQESQIKSKTVMSWSARKKKKRAFFSPFILCQGSFFKICVLSQHTQPAITF